MGAQRVVVTGASGSVGSLAVRLLHDRQVAVEAIVRRPEAAAALPTGVRHHLADYGDLDALHRAMRGAQVVVFISSDGPSTSVWRHHSNVVTAIVDAGVRHVVYLSSLDVDLASPFCYAVTNGLTEEQLANAAVDTTIVRASMFSEFFARWPTRAVETGELRVPAGSGRISLVRRDDVATALAAAATSAPADDPLLITGPDALSMAEVIARHGAAKSVRYVDVPPQRHRIEMAAGGTDAWWAYAYDGMFASIRNNRWASVTRHFADLTGREAQSYGRLRGSTQMPTKYVQ